MAHAGGGKDSEQGTHKCEMNSGEGNGKPLLDSNSYLENSLLDLQESEQTRRTITKLFVTDHTRFKLDKYYFFICSETATNFPQL